MVPETFTTSPTLHAGAEPRHFPDLWERLRYMDAHTWRTFLKNYSVEQLEARFAFEDTREASGLSTKGAEFFDALREQLKEVK